MGGFSSDTVSYYYRIDTLKGPKMPKNILFFNKSAFYFCTRGILLIVLPFVGGAIAVRPFPRFGGYARV